MNLFIDQPETFSTINLYPKLELFGYPVMLMLGLALVLIVIFTLYLGKKFIWKKSQVTVFCLAAVWSIWYLNFTYNNLYDLAESVRILRYSTRQKAIVRLCNLDKYSESMGKDSFCGMYSFMAFIRSNVPQGSLVKIISIPGTEPYFYYNLYPDYDFSRKAQEADYVIFYHSPDYDYIAGKIVKKNHIGEQVPDVSGYRMSSFMNSAAYILERANNGRE